jgi:TrmH family RNA methyltransferase
MTGEARDRSQCCPHRALDVDEVLSDIRQLQRSRPHRDRRGCFYLEGVRNLASAAEHGVELDAIVASKALLRSSTARKLLRVAYAKVPRFEVTPERFRELSLLPRASGICAIARQRWARLHDLTPGRGSTWLALEQTRSAGNLGTLLRTSRAVGGAGLILIGFSVDPFDPGVVRASMGAIFGQHLVRCEPASFRHWSARHHCHVVAASPHATTPYDRVRFRAPTVILLGEEGRGLSSSTAGLAHDVARIPMVGDIDSLNLAVAGSLLLYEVFRHSRRRERAT